MDKPRKSFGGHLLGAFNQLIPLPYSLYEDCRLRALAETGASTPLDETSSAYLHLAIPDLKESHRAVLAFREQFQRRAQAYLMAVTVATTFSFGIVTLLSKASQAAHPIHPAKWVLALFFAILISFFMSAILALRVLGPSQLYDTWLRSQLPIDQEQQKLNIIRFIALNETFAMAFQCSLRGSYYAMRNGIILLFVALGFAVARSGVLF